MVGVVGVNSRIFNSLAQSGVSVFMVSQASSENSTTFAVRNADAELAVEVLNKEFATELEVKQAPTLVHIENGDVSKYAGVSDIKKFLKA